MFNQEQLLETAINHLPERLRVEGVRWNQNNDICDGTLTLYTRDGARFPFVFEIKPRPRQHVLMKLRSLFDAEVSFPALLICESITPAMAKYCEEHDINFLDSGGNASITTPGLFLRITGRKITPVIRERPRISEGVLKLLFVLLSQPALINETYRSLAKLAGISLGMVSKAFDYLESERYYRVSKQGRRLTDPNMLLALWIREYAMTLRPGLKTLLLACESQWRNIELKTGECWGGEAAAFILSNGYLKPEIIQLFTPLSLIARRESLQLKPHPKGNFKLTSAFWGENFHPTDRALALLSVAELIASQDDRNIEVAGRINDHYLHIKASTLFGD